MRTDGDTKTRRSRRTVALPARCVEILRNRRIAQERQRTLAGQRWTDSDLVFASEIGSELDAANVRRGFRRVLASAGLPAKEWTPRELRHSFVSLLSDSGVTVDQIARPAGHSGGSNVTELIYRKQIRPVIDDGATAIDRLFPDRDG